MRLENEIVCWFSIWMVLRGRCFSLWRWGGERVCECVWGGYSREWMVGGEEEEEEEASLLL